MEHETDKPGRRSGPLRQLSRGIEVTTPLDDRIARIVSEGRGVRVAAVKQVASPYAGRNNSGIATCELDTGERLITFWKTGWAQNYDVGLPLGCVGNEIAAYSMIRELRPAPTPGLIGGEIRETEALLVIEYVGATCRIHKTGDSGAMERAAHRIGSFHERVSAVMVDGRMDRYDERLFSFWATRAACRLSELRWLKQVSEVYPSFAAALPATSATMIHGELYPRNVLVSTHKIVVVDWEWAGVGMGELDLAALTEGRWGEATVSRCAEAYAKSRGFDPTDRLFRQRLAASRLYYHLRWFGWGAKPRPMGEKARWRLNEAYSLAAELDLL